MIRKRILATLVAAHCLFVSHTHAADTVPGSIVVSLDQLRLANQQQYNTIASTLAQNIKDETMSLVEVFLQSNDIECLDLWLEGLCIWMLISVGYSGITITFEATPKLSHYNPDFVVASYPRIGASPLIESDMLYDEIQSVISEAMLNLMSDHPVPVQYRNEAQFGGRSSESTVRQKSIAMFSEVDVIGHPGNVVTLAAQGGDLFGDTSGLVVQNIALVEQVAKASEQQANTILAELSGNSNKILPSTTGNVSQWQAKLPGGGDIDQWQDQIAEPAQQGVSQMINAALSSFDTLSDAVAQVTDPHSTQSLQAAASLHLENADQALSDAVATSTQLHDLQGAVDSTTQSITVGEDAVQLVQGAGIDSNVVGREAVDELNTEISGLTQAELDEFFGGASKTELLQHIDEFTQVFESIDSAIQNLSATGVSFSGGVPGFCPKDTDVLTPHYLSGLNVMSWRYQLPELAYPQSYAFPLPNSDYYVGKFNTGGLPKPIQSDGQLAQWASMIALPDWSTWGNVYPRSGWIAQPDEVKNRALAGFRAAHVVTRDAQAHLYNYAGAKAVPNNMKKWSPAPLQPHDKTTGAWQMLSPKKSNQCTLLQNSEIDNGIITARDPDFTSESGAYVFNLWRQYQCCNKPQKFGAKAFYVETIPMRIKIL